jgi:hypothetical protein
MIRMVAASRALRLCRSACACFHTSIWEDFHLHQAVERDGPNVVAFNSLMIESQRRSKITYGAVKLQPAGRGSAVGGAGVTLLLKYQIAI